jgi:hypothetical protein
MDQAESEPMQEADAAVESETIKNDFAHQAVRVKVFTTFCGEMSGGARHTFSFSPGASKNGDTKILAYLCVAQFRVGGC